MLNENLNNSYTSKNNDTIAAARLKLGVFCQENGVYTEAINQFNEGLRLLEAKEKNSLFLNLVNNLGQVHVLLKNYKTAQSYFQKGILEATRIEDSKALAYAKSSLGTCFEKQEKYDQALEQQHESLALYIGLNDEEGVSLVNENIGSIYEDLEKYDLALTHFQKALKYHGEQDDSREANILNNLGDVYRKTQVYDLGILYTEKALEVADLSGDQHEVASSHKDLAENYHFLGELDKALHHLNQFVSIDKENEKLHSANQASALQIIYDTKEKESQIQLLVQKSKVDHAQKIVLIVSIIGVLIFLFLANFYVRKKRKQTQQEAKYKQRIYKAELDKKNLKEENLKREVELKNASLSKYSLHISQKNKILSDLSQTLAKCLDRNNIDLKRKLAVLIKEIDTNLSKEQEWEEFVILFQEIHPKYIQRINSIATDALSSAELRLSMLLRLNLNSKEIASILRLTPDSVRVSRYRLRKKLPIDSKEDLSRFLHSI
ncbi:tetratricopeptide repeat protein [Cellulophaga sp. L1A9]|uniref:tetratricopeptide repeat protein n=1 Tax=Cellulophaga sp. L1A9 TaxID=2686362 RepID=UPI00131D9D70|nr:tetratricopeptide repeat protein [Cellulophaga sp. L1A9]